MKQAVSVIVPSYRSQATLERCVRSVLDEPSPSLKEVLVVDSSPAGEMDLCLERVRRLGARIIRLENRAYPAEGRNRGAKEATGHVLAFLDSDAVAESGWVDGIAERVSASPAGGGSITLDPDQGWHPAALAQYFLQFNEYVPSAPERVVSFVPSCNLYCSRELFDRVGGFPDLRASEDVLFGRAISAVLPMRFFPSLRVRHVFGLSWQRLWSNQKLLGAYTLIYRRERVQKSVQFFRGPAALIFLPLLGVYKWGVVFLRLAKYGTPLLWLRWIYCLPWFAAGLTAWMAGFAGACRQTDGVAPSAHKR